MKKLVPFALTLALAGAAHGEAPAPAAPSNVQPGTYRVEPLHTAVLFSVSHFGFTTYYGEFSGVTGAMTLDPKDISKSHLDVSAPVEGVTTPSAKLTGELKGPEWFDAAKFPAITFHSTSVVGTGPDTADVTGDLTMHGVTRPVTFKAKFNAVGTNPIDKAYTIGFDARGHVKRTEFGVSKYAPVIGDEVHLIISAAFERQPS